MGIAGTAAVRDLAVQDLARLKLRLRLRRKGRRGGWSRQGCGLLSDNRRARRLLRQWYRRRLWGWRCGLYGRRRRSLHREGLRGLC